MKFGMRKPSVKRSISVRTTGTWKRQAKKAIIPGYGKKDNSVNSGGYRESRLSLYNVTSGYVTRFSDYAKRAQI